MFRGLKGPLVRFCVLKDLYNMLPPLQTELGLGHLQAIPENSTLQVGLSHLYLATVFISPTSQYATAITYCVNPPYFRL